MADQSDFRPLVKPVRFFKRDGAGDNPAIHLRERHAHGQIAGRKTAGGFPPAVFITAGQDHLQDRAIGPGEGRVIGFRARRGNGEPGQIENDVGLGFHQIGFDYFHAGRVFETANKQG